MTESEQIDLAQECADFSLAYIEHLARTGAAYRAFLGLNSRLARGANVYGLFLLANEEFQSCVTAARAWTINTQPPAGLPPDVLAAASEGLRVMTGHWDSVLRYAQIGRETVAARMKGRSGPDVLRKERRGIEHHAKARLLHEKAGPLIQQVVTFSDMLIRQMGTSGTPATAKTCSLYKL